MDTGHLFGNAYAEMYRFRDRHFRVGQNYEVPTYEGKSWDEFDTPAATYLLSRDSQGVVCGMSRLSPTTQPYMIQELWPEMMEGELLSSPTIWESSRMGAIALRPLQARIVQHLVLAKMEFGLANGIEAFIGVMPPKLWQHVFLHNGWEIQWLGEPHELTDSPEKVLAGRANVTKAMERSVRQAMGLWHQVLVTTPQSEVT